jgi:hypothetical protein
MQTENREINRLVVSMLLKKNHGGRSWTRKTRREGGRFQIKEYLSQAPVCNPSTLEDSKFKTSLGCLQRLYLKTTATTKNF